MPLFGSATPAAPSLNANYFMAWWSAVYARLAYLNPQQFLGRYTEIYGDGTTGSGEIPATEVLGMMNKQATTQGIAGLLDDETMLQLVGNFKPGEKRWGLNVIEVVGINATPPKASMLSLDCITNYDATTGKATDAYGNSDQVASWAEKVNIALGERRRIAEDKKNPATTTTEMLNCAPELGLKDNPQLVFRAISDSNYGTTYVFGDKRAPNLVWVVFRGTANAKSALAYSRPSSLTATALVIFFGMIDAGLIGIFKILQEQIHIIVQMAVDVAHELNPGVQLAPGSMKLLTTGHSLGGAMATAFAGEYVQQISPNLDRIIGANIFDISIGCYSLASPRVFGPKEAAAFCCLTQASTLCKKDPATASVVAPDSNVRGRISYLRVVTTLDLVTALPKAGYEHPCSEFTDGERDEITMDCDIEDGKTMLNNGNAFITNKISTRCLNLTHKRPSMTANFSKAPVCTNKRKKTMSISSMLYHLTYCGIMFAGGVDMSSALSLDVERLQPEDINAAAVNPVALNIKEDDTMMRVLWYGIQNAPVSKCVFFDLAPFRVKEAMAQGGGGINQKGGWNPFSNKTKVAPEPAPVQAAPVQAAPVQAAPVQAAIPAQQPDSSVLLEDSKMTNTFIVGLKLAIADAKYDYPITDKNFKPPVLYKPLPPSKGIPPQQYDYLYQLPADIGKSGRFTLFFGKNPPLAPPRLKDANGNPILTADEQKHLDDHHNLVADEHVAAANTAVAVINAAQGQSNPLVLPTLPSVPPSTVGATPTTTVAPAAQVLPTVTAKGGRRTRRRNKSNNRSRKGKKGARISRRRGNKRHTKRH